MSSWFKKGKKLVDELNAIVSQDGANPQIQGQRPPQPYRPPYQQPYNYQSIPTQNLLPYPQLNYGQSASPYEPSPPGHPPWASPSSQPNQAPHYRLPPPPLPPRPGLPQAYTTDATMNHGPQRPPLPQINSAPPDIARPVPLPPRASPHPTLSLDRPSPSPASSPSYVPSQCSVFDMSSLSPELYYSTETWITPAASASHNEQLIPRVQEQPLSQTAESTEDVQSIYDMPRPYTPSASQFKATTPLPSVLRVKRDNDDSTVRKVLCLDGGGVRGLSSLMIVKHLMQRLESQRGGRLEPWQEFDLIIGTSTGGLIAIMLGRLRMSVDECVDAYRTLSRNIFSPVHSKANIPGRALAKFKAEGKFESEPLESEIKRFLRERGLSEAELLRDDSPDSTKVSVCAVQETNSDCVVIRSYESGSGEWDELYPVCRIWEAARATSAASTFFDPIEIGPQRYVDGALRHNNPIEKADEESRGLFRQSSSITLR